MKKTTLVLNAIVLFSIAGCQNTQQNQYTYLFDGSSLDSWTVKCKPEDKAKTYWYIQDSAIVANSLGNPDHDYVWLMTKKEYRSLLTVK